MRVKKVKYKIEWREKCYCHVVGNVGAVKGMYVNDGHSHSSFTARYKYNSPFSLFFFLIIFNIFLTGPVDAAAMFWRYDRHTLPSEVTPVLVHECHAAKTPSASFFASSPSGSSFRTMKSLVNRETSSR